MRWYNSDTLDYSKSCMDAFNLECSKEDLKNDKYAKQVYRKLKKQHRLAKRIDSLVRKFYGTKEGETELMDKKDLENVIGAVIASVIICFVSWAITIGIVKLITLCFGWIFSWGIATGLWIILLLLKWIFS